MEVGAAAMAGDRLRVVSDGPMEFAIKRDGDHWMLTVVNGEFTKSTYEMFGEDYDPEEGVSTENGF
jgi:hypothetical protein